MIEIENLSYGTTGFSLKQLSLTVRSGSCHAIIGPTGCGKTTLLETIIGLRTARTGKILVDCKDVTRLPVHERGFSYVPQDLALFPHLTVEENILYGLRYGNFSDAPERKRHVLDLANSLNISHLLKRTPRALSGGEKQRVALVRALAPNRGYLILDEPFSALHEGMKKELWFLLKQLQQQYQLTIFMISHDMEETFFLADDISVMIDGAIQQTGTKEQIYNAPSTEKVADFFGINNLFDAEIRDVNDEMTTLYCPELSVSLTAPSYKFAAVKQGMSLKAGIRSEQIMIIKSPHENHGRNNIIRGQLVEIFKKGAYDMLLFKPVNAVKTIEIDISNYASQKSRLEKGQEVYIVLEPERFFWVSSYR
ncbi:sulfate ABC transporter, ATP-binding protein [Candidatus Moduliflexus flocculans]|uniref:Sulfate ABC transporter, ATP-binding protein n=1 Tax=Candidatus Moduliflexus flocculans TaxID=1499966 RepID=A0A081BPW9_9BACT|nr:sulfate ABC transporter, ATP-binding protein [Candidatus Moduliflexus flocculans]